MNGFFKSKIKSGILLSLVYIIFHSIDAFSFYNGQPASIVIGQQDFLQGSSNPGGVSEKTLAYPAFIFYDGNYLFITDCGNHRVLVYNSIPSTSNPSAIAVIGQNDFEHNAPNQGLLTPSSYTLKSPEGIAGDGNKLLIADEYNHRVLIYNDIAAKINDFINNGTPIAADVVVGQIYFTSGSINQGGTVRPNTLYRPYGLNINGGKLFIADMLNNRILIYNSIPITNDASADIFVGQECGTKNVSGVTPNLMFYPAGVYCDGTKLIIGDTSNQRVIIYDVIPTTHNTAANCVIGQTNFYSKDKNQGGGPNINTLQFPLGVYSDGKRLFVADQSNNRIMIFDNWSSTNASASLVIGQENFTDGPYGTSQVKLRATYDVYLYGKKLFITDKDNSRVLIFDDVFCIYNITPDSCQNTGSIDVTINGDDLLTGSTAVLKKSGEPDITGTGVIITTKTISCSFDITSRSPGFYDVVVTSGNISFTISQGFEIKSFEITKVIPEFGYKWTSTRVYIKGSNFLKGSIVKLTKSGETDIQGTSIAVSTGLITATFNLWGKSLGLWNIVITTGGINQTFSDSFLVTQLSPGYNTSPQASGAIDSTGGIIKVEVAESEIANLELIIPQDAIGTNISISITINISINPPSLPGNIAKVGRVIDLWPSNMEFNKEVEVKIPYKNSDIEKFGVTDPNLLDVYTYDANTEEWVKVAKNNIDRTNSLISVKISHFSLYTLGVTVVSDVGSSTIYPNPFKPDEHSKVTFSVPLESEVQIYNVAGELVNSLKDDNKTGKIFWTGINSSGQKVASGIYLCVIKNGTSHSTKKLAIIR